MSSSLAEGDSFKEILVRARRGPPSDISTLAGHIHEQYRAHGRAILDAISKNLEIPTQVEGFEANHRQLSAAVSSFLCLVKVARWYIANPNESGHPVGPTALISDELCEKYLFWALRMLGIPASPTSLNPSLQFLTPHILRTLYHHPTAFFDILFKVPSVAFRALSSSIKSMMLDVAIAWWTSSIDGEPPIYPLRQRENPDPNVASTDTSTRLFYDLVKNDPKWVAAAIMRGRICSPETFVRRTIGRMRPLATIRSLSHLSHLPPVTVEVDNMLWTVRAAVELAKCEPRLHRMFMEQCAPGAFVKVLATLGDLMETTVRTGMTSTTVPSSLAIGADHIKVLLLLAHQVIAWVDSSNTDTLRQVKDVISNGAVQLVFSGAVLRSSEARGHLDEIFDMLAFYGPFVEVFPTLFEHVSTHLKGTFPGPLKWQASSLPHTPREHSMGMDIECLHTMAYFSDKLHRVHLCDNLRHGGGDDRAHERKTQAERTCSGCHSVVYCSEECQKEDWRDFHRHECPQLSKDYEDRKRRGQVYSYASRSFQAAIVRYAFETLFPTSRHDGNPDGNPPYTWGRDGVVCIDLFRPVYSCTAPLGSFISREVPSGRIPAHLQPRFSAFLKTFNGINGGYRGNDPSVIKTQKCRLVYRSFRFGNEDVNLLLLLQRVRWTTALAAQLPSWARLQYALKYRERGPEANPEYVIQGALAYMSPPSGWTTEKSNTAAELTGNLRQMRPEDLGPIRVPEGPFRA